MRFCKTGVADIRIYITIKYSIMNNVTQFRFDYPVIDKGQIPAAHFTDLSIHAEAEIAVRTGKVINVKIKKILYKSPGDHSPLSYDVKALLHITGKTLHDEIYNASWEHAKDKFELQPA
jgi:hypothetical protein